MEKCLIIEKIVVIPGFSGEITSFSPGLGYGANGGAVTDKVDVDIQAIRIPLHS
jgi:hypothetical protein